MQLLNFLDQQFQDGVNWDKECHCSPRAHHHPPSIHPSSSHQSSEFSKDSSSLKIAPIVPDLSIAASNQIYCWTLRNIPPLQILQPPSHVYYHESSINSNFQDTVLSQKVRTGSGERMPTTMFTHSHSSDRRGCLHAKN